MPNMKICFLNALWLTKFLFISVLFQAEILLLKVKMTFTLLTSDQCICLKEMITQ